MSALRCRSIPVVERCQQPRGRSSWPDQPVAFLTQPGSGSILRYSTWRGSYRQYPLSSRSRTTGAVRSERGWRDSGRAALTFKCQLRTAERTATGVHNRSHVQPQTPLATCRDRPVVGRASSSHRGVSTPRTRRGPSVNSAVGIRVAYRRPTASGAMSWPWHGVLNGVPHPCHVRGELRYRQSLKDSENDP